MGFIRWLANIDRRIIFVVIGLAVAGPLLVPLNLPPVTVTSQARAIYDAVEALPTGSTVLVSFDYDPAAAPEVHPMALAFLRHCFTKQHKVIIMALWPQGAQLAVRAISEISSEFDLKYGVDYVNLGYKPGGAIVINLIGTSFAKAFPSDINQTPLNQLPLMSKVNNLKDVAMVMDLSAGDPGIPAWVMVANALFQRKVAGGTTAVSAPQFFPYLQSGQMMGQLGGMKGAAEYERLVKHPGLGSRGMDSQSVAHAVIIVFIIFANVAYFALRRKTPSGGPAAAGGAPPPAAP